MAIDWSPVTHDLLDALAAGPVDRGVRLRLAGAAADRFDGNRRVFAWAVMLEEPSWKDRERARRARLAIHEPRTRDMVRAVVSLMVLELVDGIEAMTVHEQMLLRRRIYATMGLTTTTGASLSNGNVMW